MFSDCGFTTSGNTILRPRKQDEASSKTWCHTHCVVVTDWWELQLFWLCSIALRSCSMEGVRHLTWCPTLEPISQTLLVFSAGTQILFYKSRTVHKGSRKRHKELNPVKHSQLPQIGLGYRKAGNHHFFGFVFFKLIYFLFSSLFLTDFPGSCPSIEYLAKRTVCKSNTFHLSLRYFDSAYKGYICFSVWGAENLNYSSTPVFLCWKCTPLYPMN